MHPILSCQFINPLLFQKTLFRFFIGCQTVHEFDKNHADKSSIISCIWDVSFLYQIGSS